MARQRVVARLWKESLESVCGAHVLERRMAKTLIFARTEWFTHTEWRIYVRSYFAYDEHKPRRPEPPTPREYYATWAVVVLGLLLCAAYLLQRATAWGSRNTRTRSRVAFIFVILPWVVGHRLSHFIHRKRFPYAPDRADSDFPDSPLAYLLRAMPELGESTHLSGVYDRATVLEDVEAHDPHVTLHWIVRWRQVAVTLLIATFLLIPELLQDTMFCEACDFLPVLAQFILGTGIVGGSSGGGRRKGTNVSAVVVSGFILFMIVAFVVAITVLRRVEARVAKAAEDLELEKNISKLGTWASRASRAPATLAPLAPRTRALRELRRHRDRVDEPGRLRLRAQVALAAQLKFAFNAAPEDAAGDASAPPSTGPAGSTTSPAPTRDDVEAKRGDADETPRRRASTTRTRSPVLAVPGT
ncbi:hypothetical protein JL721_8831 [Aureococcus anophagefferens]|nr:hypothetical protein JL721_8831 [Aureococcus anophagefferens]